RHWNDPPAYIKEQINLGQLKGDWYNVPPYDFYVGLMTGYLNRGGANRKDTIISFNYDMVVEDTLIGLGFPFSYGADDYTVLTNADLQNNLEHSRDDVRILKLHGSANWARYSSYVARSKETGGQFAPHSGEPEQLIAVFPNYELLRELQLNPLLVAPTWQKV